MKVYIAGIYCPYEGTCYARGIFSTREKAEAAAPWFTDHAEYFREYHHKVFSVTEYELDDIQEFDFHVQGEIKYLKYIVSEENTWSDSIEQKAAATPVLEKLLPLEIPDADL